jgi:hypothetical protein
MTSLCNYHRARLHSSYHFPCHSHAWPGQHLGLAPKSLLTYFSCVLAYSSFYTKVNNHMIHQITSLLE